MNSVAVTIVHNPSGQQGDNFSFTNEFAYFIFPDEKDIIGLEVRPEEEWDTRTFRDNSGNSNLRTDAANCFYPIFVKDDQIIGFGDVCRMSFTRNPEMQFILMELLLYILLITTGLKRNGFLSAEPWKAFLTNCG